MHPMIKLGAVSALALASALPAAAQAPYRDSPYRETPESVDRRDSYEADRARYETQRERYEDSAATHRDSQRDYREARRDYEYRMAEWNRARRIYDRRYGSGAYARMYSRPVWDQAYWTSNDSPPYAGYYGRETSTNNVRCNSNSSVAGGVIGALAGAVLGSNVAARNARTEGAVLGGVVGTAIGIGVGRANDKYRCDDRGPYFSYDDTVPYREGRRRYSSSYDPNHYEQQRCRLAAAPVDAYGRDMRYVRVCPDRENRYRITG